jgi:hypothetical protein
MNAFHECSKYCKVATIILPIGRIFAAVGWVTETVICLAHAIMAWQAILTYDGDSWVAGSGLLLLLPPNQNQADGDGCTSLDTAGSQTDMENLMGH